MPEPASEQGYSFDPKTGQVQEVEEERGGTGEFPDQGDQGGFRQSANIEDQDSTVGTQGGWNEPAKGGAEKTGSGEQDPGGQQGGGGR